MRKLFFKSFAVFVASMFCLNSFYSVYSLPDNQKALYNQNILYYDLVCSDVPSSEVSAGAGSPEGTTFPNLDPAAMADAIDRFIDKENSNSRLSGLGETIVAGAENSNISPFLIVAHAHAESDLSSPSDYNVSNGNNSFGRTATSSQPNFSGDRLWYKWSSVKASVDHTASENRGATGGGDIAAYIRVQYPDIIDHGDLDAYLLEYVADGNESWYGQLVREDVRQMASMAEGGSGDIDFEELDGLDLAGIVNQYDLHSAAVRQLGSSTSTSQNANISPNSVDSLIKLIVADAFLSTNPNLNKTITIKGSHLYGGGTPQGTPWDPKVGQKFKLKEVLTNTLAKSSNTQANVLMDEIGGPSKANELTDYNSTTVNSYFSFSGPSGAPNKSTAGDLTNAMNKIFATKNSKYKIAQAALRNSSYTFDLQSEANKWGGHSAFTGNIGLFSVDDKNYIITLLSEEKWQDEVLPDFPETRGTKPSESVSKIKNATKDVLEGLSGGTDVQAQEGCACPASGVELEGENDAVKVYNFLITEMDLTPAQASGIIGNFMRETGGDDYDFDPGSVSDPTMCDGGSCRGIAQWSPDRWPRLEAWAESKDKDPLALETQAEYLKVELESSYRGTLNDLKAIRGDTPEAARQAAYEFNATFEVGDNTEQRQANAARFFNEHVKGGGITGGSPSEDGSCASEGSGESTGQFVWPVDKVHPLSSCFGMRWGDLHTGVDIGAPRGTEIVAADGGKVELARNYDDGGFGVTIIINHGNGFWTLYGHMVEDSLEVSQGDSVSQGQKIGEVNSTGSSFGHHLHFNIQKNGGEGVDPVDPLEHLPRDGRASSGTNCPSGSFG